MLGITVSPDSLYTYLELKKILRIGRPKAEKLVREGDIPSMRTGRSYLFFGRDILNYLEGLKKSH